MKIKEKAVELDFTYVEGAIKLEYLEDDNGYTHVLLLSIIDGNKGRIVLDKKRDAVELIKKLNQIIDLDMLK